MRINTLVAAAATAILSAGSLQAQYFDPFAAPGQTGSPFWDRTSRDNGAGCNIGYVLTGQTSNSLLGGTCRNYQLHSNPFTVASGLQPTWFAHAWGDVNQSVNFGFVSGASGATLSYFGGIAGADPLRQMFVRDAGGNIVHTFDNTVSSSWTYTTAAYSFFDIGIATYQPGTNAFSWDNPNPSQFAAFGNGATYGDYADCGTACWVGAEDIQTDLNSNDYDYNDGVLQVTGASTTVPEPSSIVLMASGLVGIAATVRRRRKNNA